MKHHFTTHGRSRTPIYVVWASMIARCHNPKKKNYHRYGGRGIFVCDSWRQSFATFLKDMGDRPTDRHSIERVENNGPYCKENCVWATASQQRANTRQMKWIEYMGVWKTIGEWGQWIGVTSSVMSARVKRLGPVGAIAVPVRADMRRHFAKGST